MVKSLEVIRKHKVFAVIRAENVESALDFAEGCIKGGLRLIEITFSFPGAEEAISALSGRLGVLVGRRKLLVYGNPLRGYLYTELLAPVDKLVHASPYHLFVDETYTMLHGH